MHQFRRVSAIGGAILVACTLLGACREHSPAEVVDARHEEAPGLASSVEDPSARGSIGPVEYRFAPRVLTRAEVEFAVPPDYRTKAWATKLIARDRAALLGNQSCTYGTRNRAVTCSPKLEDGLALALLDHPIDVYRDAFEQRGFPAAMLPQVSLAGVTGFGFVSASEQRRIEFGFFPVGERTLLLARRRTEGGSAIDTGVAAVIASLRIPDPAR